MLKQSKLHISCLIALGVMVAGHLGVVLYKSYCEEPAPAVRVPVAPKVQPAASLPPLAIDPEDCFICCKSVRELNSLFTKSGFTLAAAKKQGKVPRLFLEKLPKDMRGTKATFIRALLPHILQVNQEIMKDRERLLAMQKRLDAGGHLRACEKKWLAKLAKDHRTSPKVKILLAHVDIIPPSLALSQAWIETGAGASSAARLKNSTFGHMATATQVARFDSLLANVQAYMINLNRHNAYKPFRKLRKEMRDKGQPLDSQKLAMGLLKYSVRGQAYVHQVQCMIKTQDLKSYDHATLTGQFIR